MDASCLMGVGPDLRTRTTAPKAGEQKCANKQTNKRQSINWRARDFHPAKNMSNLSTAAPP